MAYPEYLNMASCALWFRKMIYYFGYGSNMDVTSLKAKGVTPSKSEHAVLRRYRLKFNVEHFFRNEGGMANVRPSDVPGETVQGVLHHCQETDLAALDVAEAYGIGYDRIEVQVDTKRGTVPAITYVGFPSFINDRCLPTARYLNILIKGAIAAKLDKAYVDQLSGLRTLRKKNYPQFVAPEEPKRTFTAETIAEYALCAAIAGAVFDMSNARPRHEYVKSWFGGKDVTLFHLQRMDTSDGSETIEDVKQQRLSPAQRQYLNEYLHEFFDEYEYAGRFIYD